MRNWKSKRTLSMATGVYQPYDASGIIITNGKSQGRRESCFPDLLPQLPTCNKHLANSGFPLRVVSDATVCWHALEKAVSGWVYLTGQRRSKAVVSATLVHHRHMCASERPNRKIEYLAGSHLRNRWYQRHSYVKFIIVPLRDELAIDALSLAMLVSTSIEPADMSICEIRIHGDAVKKGIVSLNDSSFIRVCRR